MTEISFYILTDYSIHPLIKINGIAVPFCWLFI